jgi:TrmH family RNA methyltransferase
MEGQTLGSFRFPERGVLVIGNEGQGISGEVKSRIEQFVTIPRHAASATESLNAAVATGILAAFLTGQE